VLMLDTLGHPKDADAESAQQIQAIAALAQRGEITLGEDSTDQLEKALPTEEAKPER